MVVHELSDSDYRALARFRHALRVFLSFSEAAARDARVTPAQHQLMLAVRGSEGPGEPTISDLARMLVLRHNSVVELVRRARLAGLVAAAGDESDRRRQCVRLTPKGERVLSELSVLHRAELRRFRNEMGSLLDELGPDR